MVLRIRDAVAVDEGVAEVQAGLRRAVQLVGRHVVAEVVAAVVGEPEVAGRGVPGEADRVADAVGEDLAVAAVGIQAGEARVDRVIAEADVARRANGHVELPVGTEVDELPAVMAVGREVVADDDRCGRIVEVGLDVVVACDPRILSDVEVAVMHRDTVRRVETVGDDDDALAAAVAVLVADGPDAVVGAGADEDRALRAERQRAGVGDLGVDLDGEAGRHLQVARSLSGGVVIAAGGRQQRRGQHQGKSRSWHRDHRASFSPPA